MPDDYFGADLFIRIKKTTDTVWDVIASPTVIDHGVARLSLNSNRPSIPKLGGPGPTEFQSGRRVSSTGGIVAQMNDDTAAAFDGEPSEDMYNIEVGREYKSGSTSKKTAFKALFNTVAESSDTRGLWSFPNITFTVSGAIDRSGSFAGNEHA